MSIEAAIGAMLSDMIAGLVASGADPQQALRAGQYTMAQVKQGIVRNRHEAKICWSAFGDGWGTRAKLEGNLRGPADGN